MAFPLIPIVVGLVVAGGGLATYFILRKKQRLSPSELAMLGTMTTKEMEDSDLGGVLLKAKTFISEAKTVLPERPRPPIPDRPPATEEHAPGRPARLPPTAEEYAERYIPMYLKHGRCAEWRWGFSIYQLSQDMMLAGGAAAVTQIMGEIASFTGLDALVDKLSFLIKYKLEQYKISEDADDNNIPAVYLIPRKWQPLDHDAPNVPLPGISGYARGWLSREWADVGGARFATFVLPNWQGGTWGWLITTKDLRTALRSDKINMSTIAKAQCADGKWRLVTKAKASQYYK